MTPGVSDFTYYWNASHWFLSGLNPYAPDPVHGLMMLAPPWILAAISPLGGLPLKIAEMLWVGVALLARSLSLTWLWQTYAHRKPSWAGWVVAAFVPVFMEIVLGQMDMIMLLGVAGFVRYQRTHPFCAGMFLFLTAWKPQIAFLIWPALLLCALYLRQWKPLLGFLVTLVGASLAVVLRRPSVFLDYSAAYRINHADFYETGSVLSAFHAPAWLFYLPPILALIWLAWRWKRSAWDWNRRMPELLLWSAVASPHIWVADHVLLIPALLQAIVWLERSPARIAVAAFYCGVNGVMAALIALQQRWWYGWIIFVWLGFYLFARTQADKPLNSGASR